MGTNTDTFKTDVDHARQAACGAVASLRRMSKLTAVAEDATAVER